MTGLSAPTVPICSDLQTGTRSPAAPVVPVCSDHQPEQVPPTAFRCSGGFTPGKPEQIYLKTPRSGLRRNNQNPTRSDPTQKTGTNQPRKKDNQT